MIKLFARSRMKAALAGASFAALGAAFTPAYAQEQTRTFDIPAQPLASALVEYSQQSGTVVVVSGDLTAGKQAPAVQGELTTDAALDRLLIGSGLSPQRRADGGLTLVVAGNGSPTQLGDASRAASSDESVTDEEIVVTGTRLRGARDDGALPVNVYTRAEIDQSGQASLGGFLNTLNEVSVGSSESGGLQSFAGSTRVQLRGLPVGSTLTLLNGRRLQGASDTSGQVVDLNQIPFDAIERVEILPVGSSAIYGGDALAGVVNVVLKDDFDGNAVTFRHGHAEGQDDSSASFTIGRSFDRASFLVVGSYNNRGTLSAGERDFFLDADYRRLGGDDRRTRFCTPGTVTSTSAANLPGLPSAVAAIPQGAGALTIASFLPTSGQPNLCASLAGPPGNILSIGTESASVYASVNLDLTSNVSAFGSIVYNDNESRSLENGFTLNNVLVPASNAYNPFGVAVRVSSLLSPENGQQGRESQSEFVNPVLGLRWQISPSWDFEASLSTIRDEMRGNCIRCTVNTTARTAALASSDPATALNPFTAGRAASSGVINGIWSDQLSRSEGARDLFSAFVRGALFELPGGPVQAAFGVDGGRDSIERVAPNGAVDFERRYESLFGEVRVPLLSGRRADGESFDRLAVSLAGRRDEYSDFGEADTYQLGLEFRPVDGLLLRAAQSTAFKPPSLSQAFPVSSSFPSELLGLRDPANGNAPIVGVPINFGRNPELAAETGEASTIGLLWEPSFAPGLRLGVTRWTLDIGDQILLPPTPQFFLDNEAAFPGYVSRGPSPGGGASGPVSAVTWTYINVSALEVSGVDFDASYTVDTPLGVITAASSVTRTDAYDSRVLPSSAVDSRLGKANVLGYAPEWKGNVSLALERPSWALSVTGRYLGSYRDFGASNRTLGDRWITDLSGRLELGDLIPGIADDATLALGVVNLFDNDIEYANTVFFYDFTQTDVRGRYFSARLSIGW